MMGHSDHVASFTTETLPISHVYLPSTFCHSLTDYFKDNPDEDDCVVLGQWEIKSGRPGKSNKRIGGIGRATVVTGAGDAVSPPPSFPSTSSSGVVTRRQSSSRMKQSSGDAVGEAVPDTVFPGDFEGRAVNKSDKKRAVFAVNVVGVTSVGSYEEVGASSGWGNLQVIGKVTKGGVGNGGSSGVAELGGDACPVFIYFHWSEDNGGDNLAIKSVSWRGQHFYPGPNRLILFYYDPEEFQRWKIPDGYPLGLPQVVLNGLAYIQEGFHQNQPHFHPAFSKVPLDHQDLHACSKIPSSSFIVNNPVLNFISTRSSGLQQIIHKVTILTGTFLRTYPLLPVLNFLFLMMVDSFIGYLVTRYLLQFPNMMGLLHTTVDQMLAKLNHLLKWLRGAPAGLKLNPNLNSLYWRFFSYHIHLWANYIGILEPIFAVILYTIQYFGILGATIQVSLLKDLLSLATFHVYCLYIYATRLYSLQTTAIKALCRVFFGRKYNPLRNRIDSVQLTTPELFLSSFGFVILIFLFPTTFVYYTGFVFLRVPVLIIERLLQYLVISYNELPIISWLLVYLNSPRVADEVYLVPVQPHYSDKGTFAAFRIRLQSTRTLFSPPNVGGGIKSIVACVMDGTVLKD